MSQGRLTAAGMLNYVPDLFDNMMLPQKPTYQDLGIQPDQYITNDMLPYVLINRQDIIDKICMDTAGFSLLFMDSDAMKEAIRIWSRTKITQWQHLYNTLFYRYNPLWNKDGIKTQTISGTESNKVSGVKNGLVQNEQAASTHDQNMDLVRGYDEGSVSVPLDLSRPKVDNVHKIIQKTDYNQTSTNENTIGIVHNSGDAYYSSGEKSDDVLNPMVVQPNIDQTTLMTPSAHSDAKTASKSVGQNRYGETDYNNAQKTNSTTITDKEQGNIGVTMSQELIKAERDVALFSLYDVIVADFIKQLCVMVY